jgi:hypothetical protein
MGITEATVKVHQRLMSRKSLSSGGRPEDSAGRDKSRKAQRRNLPRVPEEMSGLYLPQAWLHSRVQPIWAFHDVGPESAQTVDTTKRREEKCHVSHEQVSGKYTRPGLKQGIECGAPVAGEGMGRRFQIDLLPNQDRQFSDSALQAFEVRQVRVKIECVNPSQQLKTIECTLDLDRSR